MALTKEILTANEGLAGLSEDQITAITTLSTNDEVTVIGAKVGEIHGQYDTDIEAITGMKRPEGTKTYDFVKSVVTDYKTKADGAAGNETRITELTTEIAGLKQSIADGTGDAVTKQQLKDAQSELTTVKAQAKTDKEAWDTEKTQWQKDQETARINSSFGKAAGALKFKTAYPKSVQDAIVNAAKAQILGEYTTDQVEGAGGKVLVFRDSKGEIARNPANLNNPFTAEELLASKIDKDVLEGKKPAGGGGTPPNGKTDIVDLVDLAGAKTQVEADELIGRHLLQSGLLRTDPKFGAEQARIRAENKVAELPMK